MTGCLILSISILYSSFIFKLECWEILCLFLNIVYLLFDVIYTNDCVIEFGELEFRDFYFIEHLYISLSTNGLINKYHI